MESKLNLIWIDVNYDNKENTSYLKEFNKIKTLKIKCFKDNDEAIKYIKAIKFEETNIIISGSLYTQFIENFKENITDIYIIPKIVVFTKNKEDFIKYNGKNLDDSQFYFLGGVQLFFDDIKDFLLKPLTKKALNIENEENIFLTNCNAIFKPLNAFRKESTFNLTFEYIDCKEKLFYPLLYKSLIEMTKTDKIDIFTESLYNKYSESNTSIKKLLITIKNILNIPLELLSKYYARLYTIESDFYKDINKDLRENKKENYLPYIKVLYEGIILRSLKLASDTILYRGGKLLNKEIEIIKDYINKKIEGLPGAIVFSKTFLSFTKNKKIAEKYLENEEDDKELIKVLFILEKDNNLDYSLSTHADIENISVYPKEKEVLFFPLSAFEIKEINKIRINEKFGYEIKLLYLNKYLEELKDYKKNIKIPDSEFKKQIIELGLIEESKIEDTPEFILKKYEEHKSKAEINKQNNVCDESKINIKQKLSVNKYVIEDFKELNRNPINNIIYTIGLEDDNNIYIWKLCTPGPRDTPYFRGFFLLRIEFPFDYPERPPSIRFITPIYHVNIPSKTNDSLPIGSVRFSTIDYFWTPETRIRDALTNLFAIFYWANPENSYEPKLAEEYKNNREVYIAKIKFFTKKYAAPPHIFYKYNGSEDFWTFDVGDASLTINKNINYNEEKTILNNSNSDDKGEIITIIFVFKENKYEIQAYNNILVNDALEILSRKLSDHFDINKKFLAIFNHQQIRKYETIKENGIRNYSNITIIPGDFEFL